MEEKRVVREEWNSGWVVLRSLKVREREKFIFNKFVDFETVKRSENGSDVSEFRGFDPQHEQESSESVGVCVFGTLEYSNKELYYIYVF